MRPVILFYSAQVSAEFTQHAHALAQHGYEVRHCANTASLRREARQCQAASCSEPLMAVLAAGTPANRAAASILAGLPGVGVLAQLDTCDDAGLVAALQLGIDAWCPRSCSSQVLVLALHCLKRRLERSAAGMLDAATHAMTDQQGHTLTQLPQPADSRPWLLRDQAWVLETPSGHRVRLTSSERGFMLALLRNPDNAASHAQLLLRHGKTPVDEQAAKQRLGVLVSRLRQKVAQHHCSLPVKSVHNWGYMFAGGLAMRGVEALPSQVAHA